MALKFLSLGLLETLLLMCALTHRSLQEDVSATNTSSILYFGFFFDETTASSMEFFANAYYDAVLQGVPEFEPFFRNVSSTTNVTDPHEFYTRPLDPNTGNYDPLYHVTAKYCGTDQEACGEYEEKHSELIDTKFEMSLVGYVLTSKTFGLRVDLTEQQRELFDESSKKINDSTISVVGTGNAGISSLFPSIYPGEIILEPQNPYPPALPVTSTRAHTTIGCAPGIAAVVTGPDALQAIEFERNQTSGVGWSKTWDNVVDPIYENQTMRVTLFKPAESSPPSEYLFVIYPRVKVTANATLSRYYQKPGPDRSTENGSLSSITNVPNGQPILLSGIIFIFLQYIL